ncbi:hypothetical protein REPUB_Repub01dG0177900 [Reevesia pubescens]
MSMTMFSKLLTKTDVEKSLLIPTSSFDVFLPFEQGRFFYINVIDKTGKRWSFPCFIQIQQTDHQAGNIESSVVSVGWFEYLCGKDVRVGDMVYLHQKCMDDDSTVTQLKIEVKRKIRLMGQDIWAAVD